MPYIRETILTTASADGVVHIAPLGIIQDGDGWVIAPFRPSTTLANIEAFAAGRPQNVVPPPDGSAG